MKITSSEDAFLLFAKWKADRTQLNIMSTRPHGLCILLDSGTVGQLEKNSLEMSFGDVGKVLLDTRDASFKLVKSHEIPKETFVSPPPFGDCVRVVLASGDTCFLFELVP
jgi:hypothetical protein